MDEQADNTEYAPFNANPTTPLGSAEQQPARDTGQAAREAGGPEIPAGTGMSARRGHAPEGMPPALERNTYPQAAYPPYPYADPRAYGGYPRYSGYPAGPRERRRISPWVPLAGGCLIMLAALMALCAAGAGVLAAVSIGSTPASDTITKSFAVSGTPAVVVRSDAGNVHVVTGAGGAVVVTLDREVRAISRDAAQRSLEAIRLTTSQDGNTVNVSLSVPGTSGFPDFFNRRTNLTITVPAAANIAANLGAGNLDITGITGTLTSDVGAGNLNLTNLTLTSTATVSVSAGNLTADHVNGTLAARVDFGHLTLNDVTLADTSTLRMSAGNIEVSGTLPSGASLDIVDHTGNVRLALPRETSARLDATSNAGNITVDPAWPVAVSREASNASATGSLGANPTGAITIHVDAGNITLDAR